MISSRSLTLKKPSAVYFIWHGWQGHPIFSRCLCDSFLTFCSLLRLRVLYRFSGFRCSKRRLCRRSSASANSHVFIGFKFKKGWSLDRVTAAYKSFFLVGSLILSNVIQDAQRINASMGQAKRGVIIHNVDFYFKSEMVNTEADDNDFSRHCSGGTQIDR